MRIAPLIVALGLLGAACASSDRQAMVNAQPGATFEATMIDGDSVRVMQDAKTGDLYIVDPASRSGEKVAIVSAHGGVGGGPLVTLSSTRSNAAAHGSAGDRVEIR